MNLKEVKKRLVEVLDKASDYERAHILEDALHQDLLTAIARGKCRDPKACAREAIKTLNISFRRYHA